MRGEVTLVLSLEGRYHIMRAIKLISPRPDCDNLFITYFCLDHGQKTYYILKINISPMYNH